MKSDLAKLRERIDDDNTDTLKLKHWNIMYILLTKKYPDDHDYHDCTKKKRFHDWEFKNYSMT